MPASRQSAGRSGSALAVMASIRGRAESSAAQRARIRRAVSRPSISGMCTSSRMTSYVLRLERPQHFDAIGHDVDAIAQLFQQTRADLLVDDIVVGQQQPQRQAVRETAREAPPVALGLRPPRHPDPSAQRCEREMSSPSLPRSPPTRCRPSLSASRLLITSPRPVPPNIRVVEVSAWVKGWNRRSSLSRGMPMPVSATVK